jgi:hypothetical protein
MTIGSITLVANGRCRKRIYAARMESRAGRFRQNRVYRLPAWCAGPGKRVPDRATLPPYTHILDLERKLRCRECDAKGKAVVSINWSARTATPSRSWLVAGREGGMPGLDKTEIDAKIIKF